MFYKCKVRKKEETLNISTKVEFKKNYIYKKNKRDLESFYKNKIKKEKKRSRMFLQR